MPRYHLQSNPIESVFESAKADLFEMRHDKITGESGGVKVVTGWCSESFCNSVTFFFASPAAAAQSDECFIHGQRLSVGITPQQQQQHKMSILPDLHKQTNKQTKGEKGYSRVNEWTIFTRCVA